MHCAQRKELLPITCLCSSPSCSRLYDELRYNIIHCKSACVYVVHVHILGRGIQSDSQEQLGRMGFCTGSGVLQTGHCWFCRRASEIHWKLGRISRAGRTYDAAKLGYTYSTNSPETVTTQCTVHLIEEVKADRTVGR